MAACACCLVWEVTRGPHAGERARFSASSAAPSARLGVGRRGACWLRLRRDLEVSGLHAELLVATTTQSRGLALQLRDCKSTNGTRVNGVAIAPGEEVELRDQDLVQVGRSVVRVRLGDFECVRAGDAVEDLVEKVEKPEGETAAVETQEVEIEMEIEEQPQETREHEDQNVFEAPPPAVAAQEVCMVCGEKLSAWSVLEQHLHVNACLDRRTDAPSRATTSTTTTVASVAPVGRKRKRQATLRKTEDEELAVALALSESLVGKEQQIDMDIALVSGELLQVDAQLKKLEKKRLALVRKFEKLEKAKRKVHKGEVLAPIEARELLNIEWALRVLFPASRELRGGEERPATAVRAGVARLVENYRATAAAEAYVTMWERCMQRTPHGDEDDDDNLYANQLMRDLRARADPPIPATETETCEDSNVDVHESDNQIAEDEGEVPDVVKRVFPNWRENLNFLKTQDLADLNDALDEMRRMRAERKTSNEGRESSERDDEDEACAFFEAEMMRLISERQQVSEAQDVEVVELINSPNDENDQMDVSVEDAVEPKAKSSPLVLSIDDSSSSDDEVEGSDAAASVAEVRIDERRQEPECELDTEDPPSSPPSTPCAAPSLSREAVQDANRDETSASSSTNSATVASDASLDRQLLAALKANESLYEAVLLLEPLELASLLTYFRDEAGIKCAKVAVVRFCDRHGITFKS